MSYLFKDFNHSITCRPEVLIVINETVNGILASNCASTQDHINYNN